MWRPYPLNYVGRKHHRLNSESKRLYATWGIAQVIAKHIIYVESATGALAVGEGGGVAGGFRCAGVSLLAITPFPVTAH